MRELRHAATLSLFTVAFATNVAAQGPTVGNAAAKANDPIYAEGYIRPPESIAKLVAAPRSSNWTWSNPSPTRKWLLHPYTEEPTLEFLGKKHYNLGGWQVDPTANRSRAMTYRNASGYELLDWATNKVVKIQIPSPRVSSFTAWSPDGQTFSYFALFPEATQIYLANPNTGVSTALTTKAGVVATNVENFAWTADGKSIVTVLVADNRGPEPKDPTIATGIRVRINENNQLKTRNYPDLLDGPYEKDLFEYYNMGQLAIVDVKTKAVTKVGAPGAITRLEPSPDAKYFRVTYIDRPFSYVLPVSSFGTHEVIIDGTGKVLKEMAKRPLREGVATDVVDPNDPNGGANGGFGGRGGGGGAADTTRRGLAWHPFMSGLMFMRSAIMDSATKRNKEIADSTLLANTRNARNGGAGAGGGAGRAGGGGAGGGGAGRAGGGRGGRGAGAAPDSAAGRPDTLFLWTAPFVGNNSEILKPLYVTPGKGTINGVQYSDDGKIMFVNETVGAATTTDAIYLSENNARFTVTRGGGGAAAPAGRGAGGGGGRGGRGGGGGGGVGLLTKEGSHGLPVVMQSGDGKSVYATATPDTANGDAAAGGRAAGGRGGRGGRGGGGGGIQNGFDRIDIKTGARTRVYETTITDMTESNVTPLNDEFTKAIATRQTSKQPAESFLIDVPSKAATQLTVSKDYWPEITNAIHKTAFAKRPDGVNIRIRVTLPADYKAGTRLPALFWFYPAEFDSAQAYVASLSGGRGGAAADTTAAVRGGPGTFQSPGQRSMAFITAAGYALVENDSPIIATPGKLPNDNYPTDLQWNLEAAVNALVDSGWVDRNKLAIGGHSYGAFSTMNALTLTTLFKAGIAGDGMYNRTLTPNGFQNERRDLWTGQATYLAMSPMLRADKLQGAILMYHSEEDQNVGTDPISSTRMYQALMANGKTASLYMYPYEDHGPVARESNLDQWARWVAWLDKYVKNPAPEKPKAQ